MMMISVQVLIAVALLALLAASGASASDSWKHHDPWTDRPYDPYGRRYPRKYHGGHEGGWKHHGGWKRPYILPKIHKPHFPYPSGFPYPVVHPPIKPVAPVIHPAKEPKHYERKPPYAAYRRPYIHHG